MKPEKVLSMLDTPEDIEELRKLCEDEIRKDLALKTNSKSRVSNMDKILKENEKNNQTRLIGYKFDPVKNKYIFTNGIILFLLNDGLGYEENPDFPNITINPRTNTIDIDLEKVLYCIKTKTNLVMGGDSAYEFNYKYLDIVTKILGECKIKFDNETKDALEFITEDNEYVMFKGIKR